MYAGFDRWAICLAYYHYSLLWGGDGEVYANKIAQRLRRLGYKPSWSEQSLETMGVAKQIYGSLVRRHYGSYVAYQRLHRRAPQVFPS